MVEAAYLSLMPLGSTRPLSPSIYKHGSTEGTRGDQLIYTGLHAKGGEKFALGLGLGL